MNSTLEKARAIFAAAVLVLLLSAFPAAAAPAPAQVQLVHVADTLLEIRGGAGRQPWAIRYGSVSEFGQKAVLVPAEGSRAWFGHAGWLRLIDTDKGMVLGRWHYPGQIVELIPDGAKVKVKIEEKTIVQVVRQTFTLDPASGKDVPHWPTEQLILSRISRNEVMNWKVAKDRDLTSPPKISDETAAKKLLPDLEEAVKRDPASPWLQIVYARVLRIVGDAQAGPAFERAFQIPSADYTELLPISAFLDLIGEREAARSAFERGYANFLERGNDPRLLTALIDRLILYHPWPPISVPVDFADAYNREIMERNYKVAPLCEGAELAWSAYADYLEKNGMADDAAKWRTRAADADQTSGFMLPMRVLIQADRLILVIFGSLIAAVLYVTLLCVRHDAQRRADAATYQGRNALVRAFSHSNFQYWSRGQRIALLSIVLVAWVATGWEVVILSWVLRAASCPLTVGMGSLAGPSTVQYLETHKPMTDEHDLFLALAYQQTGDNEKAERIYRRLPNFAESWNNLGVLEKAAGKDQDARQSFQHALDLDPNLNEAALNLGQPPRDAWTEIHQKYMPGQPMLAPPRPGRMTAMFMGYPANVWMPTAALGGPLLGLVAGYGNLFAFTSLTGGEPAIFDPLSSGFLGYAIIAALIFSIVLIFMRPRPSTPRRGKLLTLFELLLPGISPAWSILGGLALVAWIYFLLGDYLLFTINSPYILSSIAVPNLENAYRAPGATALAMQQLKPSLVWVYWVPAALVILNALVVMVSSQSNKNA